MLIYDKIWYSNLLLQEEIQQTADEGAITIDEWNEIKAAYPIGFYSTGIAGRVGLFLLTLFISMVGCLLLSLLLEPFKLVEHSGWFFFLGILNYLSLEFIVQKEKHFRSGVDDALLYIAFGLVSGSVYWAMEKQSDASLYNSAFMLLLSTLLTLRFNDRVMAAISYVSAFAFVFFTWQKLGSFGLTTMPLLLIFMSALIYRCMRKIKMLQSARFYGKVILYLEVLSLLTFYLSGNYYVVKELNDMLHGKVSDSIPFAWVFWLWTILLPVAYLINGIKNKSVLFIRSGMFLLLLAVLTIRNYYHLMPIELVLSLSGALMLILCWGINKYLPISNTSFTLNEKPRTSEIDHLNLESIIIAETMSKGGSIQQHIADKGTESSRFGGGSFGGGGAGSDF